jgi:hypothetical protein
VGNASLAQGGTTPREPPGMLGKHDTAHPNIFYFYGLDGPDELGYQKPMKPHLNNMTVQ